MNRNFPNFLTAYLDWARDGFVPDQFHLWSGISIAAGALERKVWFPWTESFSYFPNLYIMLVALPGIGKSSALIKAVSLLQDMDERTQSINFMPSQVTEAKCIELMSKTKIFEIGPKKIYQGAGYYYASEASSSLKNVYGDFIATVTDFYDCPRIWKKATMKGGEVVLYNVCFNILAGTTFDYLGKLITDENIMGGFASRINYVIHREKVVREVKFQSGGDALDPEKARVRRALMEDLEQIHKIVGVFSAEPAFAAAWEAWHPKEEAARQAMESEKMQSLLARKNTNTMKLAMILSACESSDLILREHHWHNALALVEDISKDLPGMLREAKASQINTPDGLVQAILRTVDMMDKNVPLTMESIKLKLLLKGFDPSRLDYLITGLVKNKGIKILQQGTTGTHVKLLANMHDNL